MECLSLICGSSGAKPLVPFGKADEDLRKAGTRDDGPCGPHGTAVRPFSSRPGSSGAGVIAGFGVMTRPSRVASKPSVVALGEADRPVLLRQRVPDLDLGPAQFLAREAVHRPPGGTLQRSLEQVDVARHVPLVAGKPRDVALVQRDLIRGVAVVQNVLVLVGKPDLMNLHLRLCR